MIKENIMKTLKYSTVLFYTLFAISMVGISSCGSTGIERSEEATSTMDKMDSEIKLVVVQLDATNASLDGVMKTGQMDVKKAFDLFTKNAEKMAKMEGDFAKQSDEMKARGKDYFSEWQKEGSKYKNSQIQQLSEQRRNTLGNIYGQIAENSKGVKDAFKAYVSDINEIQKFLSNDLTTGGVQAILPISQRVVNAGDNLKYNIRNVQTAIESARKEMEQNGI